MDPASHRESNKGTLTSFTVTHLSRRSDKCTLSQSQKFYKIRVKYAFVPSCSTIAPTNNRTRSFASSTRSLHPLHSWQPSHFSAIHSLSISNSGPDLERLFGPSLDVLGPHLYNYKPPEPEYRLPRCQQPSPFARYPELASHPCLLVHQRPSIKIRMPRRELSLVHALSPSSYPASESEATKPTRARRRH